MSHKISYENISEQLKESVKATEKITLLIRDYANDILVNKIEGDYDLAKFAEAYSLATLHLSIARYQIYLANNVFEQVIEDNYKDADKYFKKLDDELHKKSEQDQEQIIKILDNFTKMYKLKK